MNYPKGIVKPKHEINYSNRGMNLEADLNATNEYYLLTDKAVIYKKPTPITISKVDYSNKNESHIIFASALERALTDTKLRKALSVNAEKRALKLDKSNIMKEYESYLDR